MKRRLEAGGQGSKPEPRIVTITGALAAFITDCEARNLNRSTLSKYKLLADRLRDYASGGAIVALIGYQGGVSTFVYSYRSPSQTVQFASTSTSEISASGNMATFSGQGTLNGQAGYSFSVSAVDGSPAGSGLDTVSVTITGPNNYSYTASATVVGGDVVIHQ